MHLGLVWAQRRPVSQYVPEHSVADRAPAASSLASAYTELTCSTAMLFLFELRRQGAGVRVKVFTLDWVGSQILAALTLTSQAPLFFLSRQTRDRTLTLHDTCSVREMTAVGNVPRSLMYRYSPGRLSTSCSRLEFKVEFGIRLQGSVSKSSKGSFCFSLLSLISTVNSSPQALWWR